MLKQRSWKRLLGMSKFCAITVNGLYNIIQNSTKLYFQSKLFQTVNFVIIVLILWKIFLISNLPYLLANLMYLLFSLYLPLDFLSLYFLIKGSTSLTLLCQPIQTRSLFIFTPCKTGCPDLQEVTKVTYKWHILIQWMNLELQELIVLRIYLFFVFAHN